MPKASTISLITCGLLLATAACADDAAELSTVTTPATGTPTISTYSTPRRWSAWLDDVEFVDNSALARIQRLEEVTFLTLAESPGTRLYFGVNRDGLVGLHFRMR